MNFTARLKRFRKSEHITQADLADMLGVSTSTVGTWEIGRSKPNVVMLKKMADLFNVSIEELYFGEGE